MDYVSVFIAGCIVGAIWQYAFRQLPAVHEAEERVKDQLAGRRKV